MKVVDGVEGEVKHDDVVDLGNVEAPCSDVGADQDGWGVAAGAGRGRGPELLEVVAALVALQIAVVAEAGNACLGEGVLSGAGAGDGVAEHEGEGPALVLAEAPI